jgi:hypothetical protein
MSEQAILFAVLSYPPRYGPIKNPPIKPSDQIANREASNTTLYDGRDAYLSVYPHTPLVSEPFLLKFWSTNTDEEFRTKAHFSSCQADYVLTAWNCCYEIYICVEKRSK